MWQANGGKRMKMFSQLTIRLPPSGRLISIVAEVNPYRLHLRERRVKHLEHEVCVRLIDAHRRREPDNLAPEPAFADQQAKLTAGLKHLRHLSFSRFFGS